MLKDVLVYLDRTDSAATLLGLAADLSARHGSRLTVIFVREASELQLYERKVAELGLVSAAELDRLSRRVETSIDVAAREMMAKLDVLASKLGLSVEWRLVDGPASVVVPQHARYADLCILNHYADKRADAADYSFSEKLLFSTGRPVLFVPPGSAFRSLASHIAVAWNSSRAAARAVNDALPLIEMADRTTVLTVNPKDFIGRHNAMPADWLIEHLARHGVSARLVQLDHVPVEGIAGALQAKALDLEADLLVTGAFGHPRLWEKMLGGATRDLLDHMTVPIMMSN